MSGPVQHEPHWWLTDTIWDAPMPHEPVAFIRRRGGGYEDIEAVYDSELYTEETARKIAERGHTYVEFAYFKGLGRDAEQHEMERSRRFAEYLHQNGVRVGLYTQWGSLFTETFFAEHPEARDWVQVDPDDKPIEYGDRIHQYFRWRGCPGNPDFIAFIKSVCDHAIDVMKTDVVYFDNMCLFERHDTLCYCDHCRSGFREYVSKKFPTPEASWRRFGLRRLDGIDLPPFRPWTDYTERPQAIVDPVMQEFIEFRCEQLADAWHEVWEHIHARNAEVGLMGNPSFPRKYNERLTSAIDFWRLRRTPAFYYMENAVGPIGVRDGAISSNVVGYKYGRALGVRFLPCGGSRVPGLMIAESMAFNDGSGGLGQGHEPFSTFYKSHTDEFYRGVEPAAEVAVLRHDVSLTWRWHEAYSVLSQAQQQLLCGGIPWMPVWGQQLLDGTLDRYRLLIVPGCACLSRDEVDAVIAFVERGGKAMILENAGTFNEWHERIRQWRFAPLFGEADDPGFAVEYLGRTGPGTFANRKLLHAARGDGKAVYIPRIRAGQDAVPSYAEMGRYDGLEHLRLPRRWRQFPKAVTKLAGDDFSIRIDAPKHVFCEVLRKTDTGAILVHLVNYAEKRVSGGTGVIVAEPDGKNATVHIPGKTPDGEPVALKREGHKPTGPATAVLPGFERYALVVVA
jgi:hypothetical protein